MASRVTQGVVEILAQASPAARVTQEALEVLTHELPATGIRATQHVVEALSTTAPRVRVTQHVLEWLAVELPSLGILVTQHGLEVLSALAPLPLVLLPAGDTVQFTALLQAELLMSDGRIPLERGMALGGALGEVIEVALPDGTLNRAVLPARGGRLQALLVMSDKAVQVCVGDVAQNQPLTLLPWGVYLFLNSDMPGEQTCALSYTPGDGSVATCVVLVLMQARPE